MPGETYPQTDPGDLPLIRLPTSHPKSGKTQDTHDILHDLHSGLGGEDGNLP
jgi:hypothetical protein